MAQNPMAFSKILELGYPLGDPIKGAQHSLLYADK